MNHTSAASTAATAASEAGAADRLPREYVKIGSALVLGAAMAMLDTTVVSVASRTLAERFNSSFTAIAWVSTAYLLTLSVVVPVSGWAMERFGGRRVWLASVTAFLAGSALCGLAWSIPSLVAFRVVQALGGGLIQPVGQALLGKNVGPKYMARVMALMSVPMALLPTLGPVVGGLLVADVGWRWIFFINLPIGVLAVVLVRRWVPKDAGAAGQRFDVRGFALVSPGFAALVYGLSTAGEQGGFGAPQALLPILGGAALLAGYAVYSLRAKITPLLDLRLFADGPFRAAMATAFMLGATLFGAMFLLPLYFQQAYGASALKAGLFLAPQGLGAAVATLYAGRFTNRLGARFLVLAGMIGATAATIPFALVSADTPIALLVGSMVLRGLGLGLVMAPLIAAGYATLERSSIPRATAMFNILNRVGGSIGTAILAVMLQRGMAGSAPSAAHVAHAYGTTFGWAVGFTVLALVPAVFLPGARALRAAVASADAKNTAAENTAAESTAPVGAVKVAA